MQIRFSEHLTKHPVLEIMPNSGKFDTLDAVVTVHYFEYDGAGKRIFKPTIRPNVSFGSNGIEPTRALEWADCFKVAYQASLMMIPEYIELESEETIANCFLRITEIQTEARILSAERE